MDNISDLVTAGDFSSFYDIFKGNKSKDNLLATFNKHRIMFGLVPLEVLSDSDKVIGGKGDNKSVEDLINIYVDKLNKPYDVISKLINKQLEMGIKTELEHTNSEQLAKEIAIDHLTENPLYYSKLKKSGLADELKENKDNPDIEYGCLMLDIKVKNWNELLDRIKPEDVYDEVGFGKEKEPHITVLYGFHDNIDMDTLLEDVKSIKEPIQYKLVSVSIFENELFDVLKFDVESEDLIRLNKHFKENYENTSTFPDYHPHLTIAYIKAGLGKKYVFDLKKPIEGKSSNLTYSTVDKEKHKIKLNKKLDEMIGIMPGSSQVEIKKQCRLASNPDGTSEPCNQGEIKNIELTKIDESNPIDEKKRNNKSILIRKPIGIYYGIGGYNNSNDDNDMGDSGGDGGGMEESNKQDNKIGLEYGHFEISPKFSTKDSLFVTHLELNQDSRNKGLFKSLLNDIISYAKENEYTNIVLEPDITKGKDYYNKLVNLYKKYGFNGVENDPSLLKLDI